MTGLDHELAVATQLAREAGAVLLSHRSGGFQVRQKTGGEVVTTADLASDALIRAGLSHAFPNDALYTEETAETSAQLSSRRVWIVDPLDSTSTYVAGGDEFSVSIGLAIDGEPVVGAVFNPVRDQLIAGGRGLGVVLNGYSAYMSSACGLDSAHLTTSRKEWDRGLRDLVGNLAVTPIASMAYKLARVAAGLDDGAFSLKQRKQWGICAGAALVIAGGGRVTLLDGSPIGFNRCTPASGRGLVAASLVLQPLLCDWLHHQLQNAKDVSREYPFD